MQTSTISKQEETMLFIHQEGALIQMIPSYYKRQLKVDKRLIKYKQSIIFFRSDFILLSLSPFFQLLETRKECIEIDRLAT